MGPVTVVHLDQLLNRTNDFDIIILALFNFLTRFQQRRYHRAGCDPCYSPFFSPPFFGGGFWGLWGLVDPRADCMAHTFGIVMSKLGTHPLQV